MRITILFDNNPKIDGYRTGWGFSALIEVENKKLLFDTGGDGEILLGNMELAGIKPESIDSVLLSHYHNDHSGGLDYFLQINPCVPVFYPSSISPDIVEIIKRRKALPTPVKSRMDVIPGAVVTAFNNNSIPELYLALNSDEGTVVITGCAHPGIDTILNDAKFLSGKNEIYLALGGFHYYKLEQEEIAKKVSEIEAIGLKIAAPTHCSGSGARAVFKDVFKNKFLSIGAGSVFNTELISFPD